MEKFRKSLKTRLVVAGVYCAAVVALIVLGFFRPGDAHVNDFIAGFCMGLCIGIEFVVIYSMAKYIAALRNEEKLKKLYIKENDERIKMIQTKAGSTGIAISVGGLLLGALVAGYYDEKVFFTLVGATVFISLVSAVMKAYYLKKYSE